MPSQPASVRQGMTTVLCEVQRERQEPLRKLLTESIGDEVKRNPLVPFARLERVHFMRWVMLDGEDKAARLVGDAHRIELAYESNYDGTEAEHLDELLEHATAGIDAIYDHCVGYPKPNERTPATRRAWLLANALPTAAMHVAHPGLSARRIRADQELRSRLRDGKIYRADNAARERAKGESTRHLARILGVSKATIGRIPAAQP